MSANKPIDQRHDDSRNGPDEALHVQPDQYVQGAYVVHGGGVDHSFIDPLDPTHVEFPYMERIVSALDVFAPARQRISAVHIGGAGMTLARYIAHSRPTSAQIVLEPDEELTAEVRRVLPLPPRSGIKVRAQDGREGIAKIAENRADVLILDAFYRLAVPGDLVTSQAFAEYARVLKPDGLLAMNVTDTTPFSWSQRVLAGAAEFFPQLSACAEPGTWKGRRAGNLVLLASRVPLPLRELLVRDRSVAFPFSWRYGEELEHWRGHRDPFTDDDAQSSPVGRDTHTHFG